MVLYKWLPLYLVYALIQTIICVACKNSVERVRRQVVSVKQFTKGLSFQVIDDLLSFLMLFAEVTANNGWNLFCLLNVRFVKIHMIVEMLNYFSRR